MMRGGRAPLAVLAVLISSWLSSTSGLTTSNGQIVTSGGKQVQLRSISLSGYEILGWTTVNGDLSKGADSISKDFRTTVYRQALLGFNTVRMEWSNEALQANPINYAQSGCTVASQSAIQGTLTPPGQANVPSTAPFAAPTLTSGVCSKDLPNTSTRDRFVYEAGYYASQGFYVTLVYHTYKTGQGYYVDYSTTSNLNAWVASWVSMVKAVLAAGASGDQLLVDLMNEPDVYGMSWTSGGALPQNLGSYYLAAMDAISAVCPTCLFLVQGAGQAGGSPWANWGDGYASAGPSPPTAFFNTLLTKAYLNQVVVAPHVYCPSVTGQSSNLAVGQGLKDRLATSFGYLASSGWCQSSTCHKFAIFIGEFNYNPDNSVDLQCYSTLVDYLNSNSITSWNIWAWDANADLQYGNGGLVASDWRTINWNKLEKLSALGLTPWFASGYAIPAAAGKAPSAGTAATPTKTPATTAGSPAGSPAASPAGSTSTGLPGSQAVASTESRAVATATLTIAGPGTTPFTTDKQAVLIMAIGTALSSVSVMSVDSSTASTQITLDQIASKVTAVNDGNSTTDVSVHLEAMTTNTAMLPAALVSSIYNGAVADAMNSATGKTWTVSMAAGTTAQDVTPETSKSKASTTGCQDKFGTICLDGSGLNTGKVVGIIIGSFIGLLVGLLGTLMVVIHCWNKRNPRLQGTAEQMNEGAMPVGPKSPKIAHAATTPVHASAV